MTNIEETMNALADIVQDPGGCTHLSGLARLQEWAERMGQQAGNNLIDG
jgi:hypothetical protein